MPGPRFNITLFNGHAIRLSRLSTTGIHAYGNMACIVTHGEDAAETSSQSLGALGRRAMSAQRPRFLADYSRPGELCFDFSKANTCDLVHTFGTPWNLDS